jgi:hypothetical protein
MLTHSGQQTVVPGEHLHGTIHPEENRLVLGESDELAQLEARQLQKERRLRRGARLALEPGECGEKRGGDRAGIDLDLYRDGIAAGSGGKIWGKQNPEHGVKIRSRRLDASFFARWTQRAAALCLDA